MFYYKYNYSVFISVDYVNEYCIFIDTMDNFLVIKKHSINFFYKLDINKIHEIEEKEFIDNYNKILEKFNQLLKIKTKQIQKPIKYINQTRLDFN